RKLLTQAQKDSGQNFLFASMRTAAEQHWTLSIRIAHAGYLRIFLRFSRLITPIGIVFDAADGANPIARYPDRDPSINVIRLLRANQIQQLKCGRHEKSEPAESSLGSRRQARVHQYRGNSAFMRQCHKSWP